MHTHIYVYRIHLLARASRSQWDIVVLELLGILEASLPRAEDDRASEAANASCEMDNTCRSRNGDLSIISLSPMKYTNIPARVSFYSTYLGAVPKSA